MKILIFSLGPVFPHDVHGGSQKMLRELSVLLALRGHVLTILCTKRDDNYQPFELRTGVTVKPILPFKQTFPAPYYVAPYQLQLVANILLEEVTRHDVLYLHDGGLSIDFIKNRIPTVISLRDFTYPETILGAFNFDSSAVIVNSHHTHDCLLATVGKLKPGLAERLHIIWNGYDAQRYRQVRDLTDIKQYIKFPAEAASRKIICFPHRPDPDKGIFEALCLLQKLATKFQDFLLLIPNYLDLKVSNEYAVVYEKITAYVIDNNLTRHVIFHDWIPYDLMPAYYSLSDAVLCVGSFVESFSNAAVEALLCGTPVVSSRCATYRTFPMAQFMEQIDYGDHNAGADALLRIFSGSRQAETRAARAFIQVQLTAEQMVDAYEHVLVSAEIKAALPVKVPITVLTDETLLELPPWCYIADQIIYNDYRKCYYPPSPQSALVVHYNGAASVKTLLKAGLSLIQVQSALEEGMLLIKE